MKPIITLVLFVALVFVSYSCNETKNKNSSGGTNSNGSNTPTNFSATKKLSPAKFNNMRTRWQDSFFMYRDTFNYFEVPIDDLKLISGERGVTDSRFYFGMDSLYNPHLMLIGVNSNKDTFFYSKIADYTKVCPIICPPPRIQ